MNCEQASDLLGQHVDGELAPAVVDDLKAHLASCTSCRVELGVLSELAAELAAGPTTSVGKPTVSVPDNLWPTIERRLPQESPATPSVMSEPETSRLGRQADFVGRAAWRRHVPLAIAASILLALGLSMFGPLGVDSPAQASVVDFSGLLDALPNDARKAFRKFLVLYGARESSPIAAKRFAPSLNFDLPEKLPGGFRLDGVYLLRFGKNPGVAATYERDGDFLGTVFHPPVNKKNYGPHSDYPCMVGDYEGHKVSVGQWRLVHLTDPTTCHCVLSRLDEKSELPAIMAAIAPNLPAGATHHEHCD